MDAAVVVFPGSNCDRDCLRALQEIPGCRPEPVWHQETRLDGFDLIVLPGGFSYGDYLRSGAIARFSPVVEALRREAARGVSVLGICNGFQVLLEAGLLPGAMRRNENLKFVCKPSKLKVMNTLSRFTSRYQFGEEIEIPVAHGEGNYYCDAATLSRLEENGQVLFRYTDNPNGSVSNIAGICNEAGNVLGMMPHPERATRDRLGSTDGKRLFESLVDHLDSQGPGVAL